VAQRTVTILLVALTLAIGSIAIVRCSDTPSDGAQTPPKKPEVKREKVVIADQAFELELANDDQTREKGLMNRESIPDHGGMLFVFPDSKVRVQNFWMGHCLVDMDIIFMDRRGTVTAVHRMKAQPPQKPGESDEDYRRRIPHYSSVYPAQFAIELKSGWLDKLNVKVDQRIELDVKRLKESAR
jgi:uncharacterized protein